MKKYYFILFFLILNGLCLNGQVTQFPQVYYSTQGSMGQNIWSGPSMSGYTKKGIMISKIGAVSLSSVLFNPYGNQNWIKVCLPSSSGNIDYGYMLCNEFYARINETNKYATVTTDGLNIRTVAGTANPNVKINGSDAKFGNNSIIALTDTPSKTISGVVWYEVYLPTSCIPSLGWVSSAYLTINSNTTNYRIVGGRVTDKAQDVNIMGDLGGATVTLGGYGTTLSSGENAGNAGGYYEYKLPTNSTVNITCTHPNFTTSTPLSINFNATSHNYTKHFIMSNIACSYSISPASNLTVPVNGGSNYQITVTAASGCTWSGSVGSDTWIISNTNGTQSGNGNFSYTIGSNPYNTTRTGYITIAGKSFTVTQAAANSVTSSFAVNDGYVNTPITFTDKSIGSPSINSWYWDFGDGKNSSYSSFQSTINHPYTTTGQKTISLTVKNSNNNSQTSSQTITISNPPAPIVDFNSNNIHNINPNTIVQFYDASLYGTSFQWTFEDASSTTNTNTRTPTATYTKPGSHRVTLTVSNSYDSRTKSIPGYITVVPLNQNQQIPSTNNIKSSTQVKIAEPIQAGTGTYEYSHLDFNLPTIGGSINFTRFYNTVNNSLSGLLGVGWSHTYNYYIDIQRDATTLQDTVWSLHYPDGHFSDFIPFYTVSQDTYPRKSFSLNSGTMDSLVMISSNKYILYTKDNDQLNFNSSGQLTQIVDLNNNTTTINYSGNKISSIVGQGGRNFLLTYQGSYISSITEPNNRKYTYSYDANGNLISDQDPKGGVTKYSYDANHRMTIVVNSLNNAIVTNIFDSQGRVIKQMDANNQITTLAYDTPSTGKTTITNPDNSQIIATHDQFARKTNVIDELNYQTSYTYDDRSNETVFTNENGQSINRQFDWMGNVKTKTIGTSITSQYLYNICNTPTQITDPNGKITIITYDTKNNPLSIHLPDNTYQYYTYNSDGTKNKFTDGRNNSTTYTYSSNGDFLTTVAPNGTKKYSYDLSGRLTSITDENNHQSQIVYDDNDNIKTIADALSRTTEFTYDINNQLSSIKDKNGNLTSFSYDKKGRLITNTNPKGGVTTYTYDSRDNLLSITDPNNHLVSYTYDSRGRKLSVANSLGTTRYKYDGVGNLTNVIDATDKTVDYAYTITNKIQSVKDGLQNTTAYTYDKNDNLLTVVNALNKTTTYSYDAMNRLINILDAASKNTIITYDENGNKKTITDPNGHLQSFNYDAANRLILQSDAGGNNTSYSYDPAGNILSLITPTGTISKTYDYANRVLTITNPGGNNYTFTYDKNDNIATMLNNNGTSTLTYDNLNHLTQYTDPYNKTVSFTYDIIGNKTSVTYPGNHKVNYKYDNANNLNTVTDWLNKTFTYSYDAAGRNTQLVYPNGIHNNVGFDEAARLLNKKNTTSTNTIINSSQFVLDAIGNRISENRQGPIPSFLFPSSKTYSYSNDDVLKTNSFWNYTNDASGNRTIETKGTKTTKYTFSVDNLLNNTTDTLGVITAFNYDPLGHRISKTVGTTQSRYVLDLSTGLSQVLQITDAGGILKSDFVYGLGLLESVDPSNNALFYHFDAQHNTVALTNQNAIMTDTYTYDPFGSLITHTGTTLQPFTFLGEYGIEQETTSVYYVRARYYDAYNGRFICKDKKPSELLIPQTINRYVYSINNPLTLFDITGLCGENDNKPSLLGTIFNKGQTFLNDLTDNFGYYSIEASLEAAKILGNSKLGSIGSVMKVTGYVSTAATVGKTINQGLTDQISTSEVILSNFVTGFPYLTTAIGTSLGGPEGGVVGGYAGNLINSFGNEIGTAITNTNWGLKAANSLLNLIK